MKVFVTGVAGQLGHDVMNELAKRGYEGIGTDIAPEYSGAADGTAVVSMPYVSLDITDADAVDRVICEMKPDVVVHCAAWTAVDLAEDEDKKDKVHAINADGTANIAKACKKTGSKMVYISTDYVFDGQGTTPWTPDCKDYKPLNVYGQTKLEGELAATALGAIYTFGPTFRAENSNTPRHLAEFWMIEPEVAFNDIADNMDLAEEFIKYCVKWALDNCADDVKFLNDMFDKGLIERLQGVLKDNFVRLPYTDGIKILEEAVAKGHKFEFPVYWGVDLASEHERYLVEEHFKCPVILTDYPKEIKAFYMKQNEDGKTVRAMDVLFPKIGEIIGGSERESDYDKLMTRIEEMHIPMKDMWWYLDTRKFGTCPHSGFGLGFERLLLFVTGMSNIRDVIPFPRTPRNADF